MPSPGATSASPTRPPTLRSTPITTPDALALRLTDALHTAAAFGRADRRQSWTVAIDLHYVPYYGDKGADQVVGGQKKQGTKFFHCYGTAVLIRKGNGPNRRNDCYRASTGTLATKGVGHREES